MSPRLLALGAAGLALPLGVAAAWGTSGAEVSLAERWLHPLVGATWLAAAVVVLALVGAAGALATRDRRYDHVAEVAAELAVGVSSLVLGLGVWFATREWGVWWSWDPRQVTAAVMLLMFVGVLLLRWAIRDPDLRIPRAAAVTAMACVDLPIVYEVVSWWQRVHPLPVDVTTGATLQAPMVAALYAAALGALAVAIGAVRYAQVRARSLDEAPEELPA